MTGDRGSKKHTLKEVKPGEVQSMGQLLNTANQARRKRANNDFQKQPDNVQLTQIDTAQGGMDGNAQVQWHRAGRWIQSLSGDAQGWQGNAGCKYNMTTLLIGQFEYTVLLLIQPQWCWKNQIRFNHWASQLWIKWSFNGEGGKWLKYVLVVNSGAERRKRGDEGSDRESAEAKLLLITLLLLKQPENTLLPLLFLRMACLPLIPVIAIWSSVKRTQADRWCFGRQATGKKNWQVDSEWVCSLVAIP